MKHLLYDLLAAHLLWVETMGEHGERANLSEAILFTRPMPQ